VAEEKTLVESASHVRYIHPMALCSALSCLTYENYFFLASEKYDAQLETAAWLIF